MTQNDEGDMLAPMWLFDHVAACIRDGKATEEMARNVECLRGGMEAQAARIAELDGELADGSFYKESDIDAMLARAEAAEAEVAEMTRRRDEWRKKAEGYDAVRLALREKVGTPWPPNMSRILWAGIAADEKKRADDAEAEVARLREAIRHAHETLYELNPCNYDHDEVCRLNDASVEVILALATMLGETHGKTLEWWDARAALQPKQEDV